MLSGILHLKLQGNNTPYHLGNNLTIICRDVATVSRDGIVKIVRHFSAERELFKGVDQMLDRLLAVFADSGKSIRAKAMKSLTIVVEADPSMLGDVSIPLYSE